MKIYICGQITGVDNYAQTFEQAEQNLIAEGYEVVNPCKLPHKHDKTWKSYMKEDIKAMIDCDAIYLLPNWRESSGATIEFIIALSLKMLILTKTNLINVQNNRF